MVESLAVGTLPPHVAGFLAMEALAFLSELLDYVGLEVGTTVAVVVAASWSLGIGGSLVERGAAGGAVEKRLAVWVVALRVVGLHGCCYMVH